MLSLPRSIVNQLLHQAQLHAGAVTFGYLQNNAGDWQVCPAAVADGTAFLSDLQHSSIVGAYLAPNKNGDAELFKSQLNKEWLYLEIVRQTPGVLEILAYRWCGSAWLNCPLTLLEA